MMSAVSSSFSITRTEIVSSRSLRALLAGAGLTLVMALGAMARLYVPFTPVPFTLQTFFLFYGAMALGRRSMLSQGAYLGLGALGAPVFAGFACGFSALCGPTAGFLFGFLVCSFLVGTFVSGNSKRSVIRELPILLIGMFSYFIPGVMWLMVLSGGSLKTALVTGFLPFFPGDLIKMCLAYILYRKTQVRLNHLF